MFSNPERVDASFEHSADFDANIRRSSGTQQGYNLHRLRTSDIMVRIGLDTNASHDN
jgi:hypothetical protein